MSIIEARDGLRCSVCAWRAPPKMVFKTSVVFGDTPIRDLRVVVWEARFDCPQCGQCLVLRFDR